MRTLSLLILLLVAVSCGASGRVQRQVTAVDAVAATLDETDGRVKVRYNPAQCACAPFEIRTSNAWVRVEFTEADEMEALDALITNAEADGAQGILGEYQVLVSLVTTTPSYCQNRVPYATLRLEKE